jgi:hypothetical protein
LAQIGLINRINEAALSIDSGRKGFAIIGKEREGRISYEDGISEAMAAFQEAQTLADPETLILAEYTFITQEFQFSEKDDKDARNSLTKAIDSFKDAILALKAVDRDCYKITDDTYPHNKDYRINGYPLDAFHVACKSHKTRIQNILKAPGIEKIEKALLKQRLANLSTAQQGYIEKQKTALQVKN